MLRNPIERRTLTFLVFICILLTSECLDPTGEIQLYPNTENSNSLYIFSFKLSNDIPSGSYLLINLDWYSSALLPYECIMVNTSIELQCTNFNAPTFDLTITVAQLHEHNEYLTEDKTVAVLLNADLTKDTEYFLQLHLFNIIPNIRKISPSAEIYVVSKDGLVYEENINYGSAIHRPPIDIALQTSILNDLSTNVPGELSTFKAEFKISVPIETALSAFTLVLHSPFSFSLGSIPRAQASTLSATSTSSLYIKPTIFEYRIISPNIFYVVFNESFPADRRFILEITEINNPFLLAQSNISIFSLNYNSLTPLEAFEYGYPIATVTQDLSVNIGLLNDAPLLGPMNFYKNQIQYVKIKVDIPKTVPEGYAIRVVYTGGSYISEGSAFANFQGLDYDPVYEYGTSYFIVKGMGQILVGSIVDISFKIHKATTPTNFQVDVYIDTEAVISSFTAASYMYYGRDEQATVDRDSFVSQLNSPASSRNWNVFIDKDDAFYLRIQVQHTLDTSTGSYLEMYFNPTFEFKTDWDGTTDCRIQNIANSAICTKQENPTYKKLTIRSSDDLANPFPGTNAQVYVNIWNLSPTVSSSNNMKYSVFVAMHKSNATGAAQYYDSRIISVTPRYDELSNVKMEIHGNVFYRDYTYPSFIRVESKVASEMNFVTQENEQRVIILTARYGFDGMGTIPNQGPFPCTSNLKVECTFLAGNPDYQQIEHMLDWDRIVVRFPDGDENTTAFHVIVPYTVQIQTNHWYYHYVGVYNKLTKDYQMLYMRFYESRSSWATSPQNVNTNLYVDMGGKAGSYRSNVTVNVANSDDRTGDYTFLGITTSWSFFEMGISSISSETITTMTNPTFSATDQQGQPLSTYMGEGRYLTLIPFTYTTTSAPTEFQITLNNVHMPYDYDLPDYYIFVYNAYDSQTNGNTMSSSNEFLMTNAGIFYGSPLKSLTIDCLSNALGVKNTKCTIKFGTQHPLKADGKLKFVFSGMTVASDVCKFYHTNGTLLQSTCSSTEDNKNITLTLNGWEHYPADNFTVELSGIGIEENEISQSFTLYVLDETGLYTIEEGTRILTTTIATEKIIEVYEILYSYNSPLSYNKMSIKFYLPREIYSDEQFGFVMGKDLSDVNTEIKRLNIILTKSDGSKLSFLYRLISSEFKVMFNFDDPSLLTEGNYTMEIYGIRTPASHENGDFNIIFQRHFDSAFTLINEISASFPALDDYITSQMSLSSYFNTEGFGQQIDFSITNRNLPVNDEMVWVINFPSYYSPLIFNYNPYCLIDGSPINCHSDPNTPYQLIVDQSPAIISAGTSYTISILGIACPRVKYMGDVFPNRYLFVGVLENSQSTSYEETSLLYPEQTVYNYIDGIINVVNIEVPSTDLTSFHNVQMIIKLKCNVDMNGGEYLYLEFPAEFDNFNNKALNVILSTTSLLGTLNAPIFDRRMELLLPTTILADTQLLIEITNVPTPTQETASEMSKIHSFLATNTKKQIRAASATSGNSAPKLTFTKDPRYISFNDDQPIVITAGTYSSPVKIKSSDGNPFLTNVKVSLSSTGFLFEPSEVLLKLGEQEGSFKIAADKDLLPLSYFYNTTKQEEVETFYKITTNNNIRITNTPISIAVPSTAIDLPIGGCSEPFLIKLTNAPMIDMMVTFSYDNLAYGEDDFFPNPHTTPSELDFTNLNDNNTVSFCASSSLAVGTNIEVSLTLTGTNYDSYAFTPTNVITFSAVDLGSVPTPTIAIELVNQQKTFLDLNITIDVDSTLYYELYIGDSPEDALSAESIQIKLKDHISVIEELHDFVSDQIYLSDRDQRIGQLIQSAGEFTVRFDNMVPEADYMFCTYAENRLSVISDASCQKVRTQSWGETWVMKVEFDKTVTDFELNKVMCFFTKFVDTSTEYLINIEGNSCNDNQVRNTNFAYPATTFSEDKTGTFIYLITNPTLTSDPSPIAFLNMFDTDGTLNDVTLAAALSGYGIDFMSGYYFKKENTRELSYRTKADSLDVSFTRPVFDYATNTATIQNVALTGPNYGTVYFALVLYKQFVTDSTNGTTQVRIRLNEDSSEQQLLNCQNWQNHTVEGCARAVYSGKPLTVTMSGLQNNSLYLLYYTAANQFPLRPVVSYAVTKETLVTLDGESLKMIGVLASLVLIATLMN